MANYSEDIMKAMQTAPVNNPETIEFQSEPVQFNAASESIFTSTKMMEKSICSFLQPIFSDLKYVSIIPNDGSDKTIPNTVPYGEFYVNLYFTPTESDQEYEPIMNGDKVVGKKPIIPFKTVQSANGGSAKTTNASTEVLNRVYRTNGQFRNRCRMYQINQLTRTALAPYMFEDPKRIDWRMHTVEIEDKSNLYSNHGNYFIGVIGLSLGKFIDAIYGPYDANGEPIDYRISLVRNIVTSFYGGSRNYIIAIHRMSRAEVRKLAELTNSYPGPQVQFGTMVR